MPGPLPGPLEIRPVRSLRERRAFVCLPWQVYAGNPAWVPPLRQERARSFQPRHNPVLRHLTVQRWLAWRGAQPVGTIAAMVDARISQPWGGFGFFEVLPDPPAAAALLHTAERWLASQGKQAVRGPFQFAYDNDCGLLLDSYDQPPMLMTAYNPPDYCRYLEQAGYRKAQDWYAYTIDRALLGWQQPDQPPPRMQRALDLAQRRSGVTVRPMRRAAFAAELAHAQRIYNAAWQHNPGFVPMDDAEIAHLARALRPVLDPDLVLLAEADGQVVAMSITLPNLNQVIQRLDGRLLPFGWWRLLRARPPRDINTLRFFALGVLPAYHRRGVEALLYAATFRAAVPKGYQHAELSLVAEQNMPMRRSAEAFGARIAKTYRVYEKNLVHCARLRRDAPGRVTEV